MHLEETEVRTSVEGSPVRVGIVDDHAMVADGLKTLLSEHADIDVVGTAATAAEAIELVDRFQPDVLLLDFRLPDGDGAGVTEEVLRRSPSTRVVMLSAVGGDELLARSIEAGCSGFLPKDRSGDEVVHAVPRPPGGSPSFRPMSLSVSSIV